MFLGSKQPRTIGLWLGRVDASDASDAATTPSGTAGDESLGLRTRTLRDGEERRWHTSILRPRDSRIDNLLVCRPSYLGIGLRAQLILLLRLLERLRGQLGLVWLSRRLLLAR